MKIKPEIKKIFERFEIFLKTSVQHHTLKDELFNNNWYPISHVRRVEKDPNESIDEFMIRIFTERYDEIKEYCLELNPTREVILKEAFKLFEEENFIACIPLFLIQTDGIARDYGAKGMFSGEGCEKRIKDQSKSKFIPYINKFAKQDLKRAAFFLALNSEKFIGVNSYEELLITKKTQNTNPEENFSLNRHGILHGFVEYQNYPNKINALRSICFMVYTLNIGELLKLIEEEEASK